MIPESFLQELKDRISIEDYIGRSLALKRSGSNITGLCPFHSEKTPSFTVFPDTQSFYCFGCGAGGDVIVFAMRIENLDYVEAIRLLAAYAGLEVPEDDAEDKSRSLLKAKILEMNKLAARFFYTALSAPSSTAVQEYLNKRQLTPTTVKHFGLGYAPNGWTGLLEHLKKSGYTEDEIVAAGLAVRNAEKKSVYDKFRNRLMFPIIDLRGNIIAFGGRVLDDSKPKYLNSPDTLAFKKSLHLFALNFAKNTHSERLILCEGYMDVISIHQAGFPIAVATLGTAITREQARLVSRYCKEVVLAYDADGAGQAATGKAISYLNDVNVTVKVLNIVGGKDPDEYIKTFGAERFRQLLDGSGGHIDYKLDRLLTKYDLTLTDDTVSFLKESGDILASVHSSVEREVYINRIAKQTNINKEEFLAEVNRKIRSLGRRAVKADIRIADEQLQGLKDKINPDKQKHLKAARAEEGLIAILLEHPDYLGFFNEHIASGEFVTDFNRRVYEYVVSRIENHQSLDLTMFSKDFTVEEMGRITGLTVKAKIYCDGTRAEALDYISVIKAEHERLNEDFKALSPEDLKEKIKRLNSGK